MVIVNIAYLQTLVVQPEDSLCTALVKIIKSYYEAWRYMNYKYDSSGNISAAYCADLKACAATAAGTTTT